MAVRLDGWLKDEIEGQLLLGNHWLQEKNKKKESGIKSEYDRSWQGLYHDNGSCLDIINSIHPERNSALLVIQTQPLTLTDGQHHIVAHLTPGALQDLSEHNPSYLSPQSTIAVRKYTIRVTSYGPPRDKLRFILHRVDLLGINHERVRRGTPLHWVEEIGIALQQLHRTRELEDRRCLQSGTLVEADEEVMAPAVDEDVPAGESTAHTQLPHTQLAFGTQIVDPTRPRIMEGDPQFLGINRMEPVMAGSTQRESIRPTAANSDYEKHMTLLSLINKSTISSFSKPSITAVPGFVQTSFSNPQPVIEPPASQISTRPMATQMAQPVHPISSFETEQSRSASPTSKGGMSRVTEPQIMAPPAAEPLEEPLILGHEPEGDVLEDTNTSDMGCSWMKGFVFDRKALIVGEDQRKLLQKDTSWHKTQPGVIPFPDGNIPIEILGKLGKIVDERAAAENTSSDDREMDVDSSPDSTVEELDPSPESILQATQDAEPTTSQVSWPASPSPEPPQQPTISRQGLPPDSSFETQTLVANKQSAPVLLDSSNEKELSAPPSSPPIRDLLTDSDEEMEMEISVPQGLGEDSLEPRPIVQVKETPYVKGKNAQPLFDASPRQKQDSSGNSKDAPSTSIVYGTYNEPESSNSIKDKNCSDRAADRMSGQAENERVSAEHEMAPARGDGVKPTKDSSARDGPGFDELRQPPQQIRQFDKADHMNIMTVKVRGEGPPISSLSPSPQHTQLSPKVSVPSSVEPPHGEETASKQPQLTSASAKRKFGDSPSKSKRRHTKRREIKIVGFGDDSPPTMDSTSALRKDRAESLRRFREERKSSTNFASRSESVNRSAAHQDTKLMDIDTPSEPNGKPSPRAMSPRHMSLYEEPLPTKSTSRSLQAPQFIPKETMSAAQSRSPPAGGSAVPGTQFAGTQTSTTASLNRSSTVFQSFKVAYPEYTGDVKHFQAQCMQMHKLDLEDKMVPKWQWDDFIIRNRTDYRDYALDCVDSGENPEPYYRFYKDTIRDTMYKGDIINSRQTLLRALEELGVKPPVPEPHRELTKSPRKDKPLRTSLPSAFSQSKKRMHERVNDAPHNRPRHSLPVDSLNLLQTPASKPKVQPLAQAAPKHGVSSTSKSNLLSRLAPAPTPRVSTSRDASESTGDPFRDFLFGFQRMTSWTGSTKVDPSKPWPQNLAVRPSIADAPKKKADVLSWKDVL